MPAPIKTAEEFHARRNVPACEWSKNYGKHAVDIEQEKSAIARCDQTCKFVDHDTFYEDW